MGGDAVGRLRVGVFGGGPGCREGAQARAPACTPPHRTCALPARRLQLRQAGVEVCSPATPGANTGTVVVLTSPDAQRTMLSYLGSPAEVSVDAALEAAIARSRLLVVEGYLW